MSSLHALLRKGRVFMPLPREGTSEEKKENLCKMHDLLLSLAKRPECILVNANSVADDLVETDMWRIKTERLHEIPYVMPPFRAMWIEFKAKNQQSQSAVLVNRIQREHGEPRISLTTWLESDGSAHGPMLSAQFLLDESGAVDESSFTLRFPAQTTTNNNAFSWLAVVCALHALSRMNCKNTELRPMREGKLRPHPINKPVPASVWHEIVITSVPKIRSTGRDVLEHEKREIRAHWIRGHYADYRNGAGLFGNPKLKALFWIPEYRKGDEELGQVIPEYTVKS